jgi:uncharacterized protein
MDLISEILSTCAQDWPVRVVCVGSFVTMVQGEGSGLASTFRDPCPDSAHRGITDAGRLHDMSMRELAAYALHEKLIEASVGMAALNGLLPVPERITVDLNASELIAEKGQGKNVAVVGDFPFLKKLKHKVGHLEVISESPHNGLHGIEKARKILPEMDVVALTGSAFINHTFDALLHLAKHAYVLILGGTTPLSPVLFDHGVDVLCGSVVSDHDKARNFVMQGSSFRHLRHVRKVAYIRN